MIELPQKSGAVRTIEFEVDGAKDLALIDNADGVWVVVPIHYMRWWDLATFIWWFFCPMDKKATIKLRFTDGKQVLVRAIRVATKYVRLRGTVK
jgi:hypothetical protein